MNFLGIDVHIKSTTWCLLDSTGEKLSTGKVLTTAPALMALVKRLSNHGELTVGQEVGKMAYLVYDAITATGTPILSFNAYHLRMIAASRKKTDKRDAYWIAKALQTGMTPHPVYIPTGEIRQLRQLLSLRRSLSEERRRWILRTRAYLSAAGWAPKKCSRKVENLIEEAVNNPLGIDSHLDQMLQSCLRSEQKATAELAKVEAILKERVKDIDVIKRLKTIPGVGDWVSLHIYVAIGDVTRFKTARQLASYAGLVPMVKQSGSSSWHGGITKQGNKALRSALVQAGHILLSKCQTEETLPLKSIAQRVHANRMKRKVAVVAAARHILRISFYIMRDGTEYDHTMLNTSEDYSKAA